MLNQRQVQIFYILIAATMAVWILFLALVFWLSLGSQGTAPIFSTPGQPVSRQATVEPTLLFPATWTPTTTPTPTPTGTLVPTYPPWATWTPTATFTPRPPTSTPRPAATKKAKAIKTYKKLFQQVAAEYDLDWRLMIEQGYWESGLNPKAIGKDYDMGLMQIIPSTWYRIAPQVGVSDPFDPYSNIVVAAVYLRDARENCRGLGQPLDECMLLAYNWGITRTRRFFLDGGTWEQVPYKQRLYVYYITRAARGK